MLTHILTSIFEIINIKISNDQMTVSTSLFNQFLPLYLSLSLSLSFLHHSV